MVIGYEIPAGANIFAHLGFEKVEAENLLVRSKLMHAIAGIIRERGLKQREAAALFGVSQPRISDLKHGRMESFTIDSLVNMLAEAGMEVRVTVKAPDKPADAPEHAAKAEPESAHATA